ncbi:hypothetical protein ACFXON_24735, partial [Bacillus subtilis]
FVDSAHAAGEKRSVWGKAFRTFVVDFAEDRARETFPWIDSDALWDRIDGAGIEPFKAAQASTTAAPVASDTAADRDACLARSAGLLDTAFGDIPALAAHPWLAAVAEPVPVVAPVQAVVPVAIAKPVAERAAELIAEIVDAEQDPDADLIWAVPVVDAEPVEPVAEPVIVDLAAHSAVASLRWLDQTLPRALSAKERTGAGAMLQAGWDRTAVLAHVVAEREARQAYRAQAEAELAQVRGRAHVASLAMSA